MRKFKKVYIYILAIILAFVGLPISANFFNNNYYYELKGIENYEKAIPEAKKIIQDRENLLLNANSTTTNSFNPDEKVNLYFSYKPGGKTWNDMHKQIIKSIMIALEKTKNTDNKYKNSIKEILEIPKTFADGPHVDDDYCIYNYFLYHILMRGYYKCGGYDIKTIMYDYIKKHDIKLTIESLDGTISKTVSASLPDYLENEINELKKQYGTRYWQYLKDNPSLFFVFEDLDPNKIYKITDSENTDNSNIHYVTFIKYNGATEAVYFSQNTDAESIVLLNGLANKQIEDITSSAQVNYNRSIPSGEITNLEEAKDFLFQLTHGTTESNKENIDKLYKYIGILFQKDYVKNLSPSQGLINDTISNSLYFSENSILDVLSKIDTSNLETLKTIPNLYTQGLAPLHNKYTNKGFYIPFTPNIGYKETKGIYIEHMRDIVESEYTPYEHLIQNIQNNRFDSYDKEHSITYTLNKINNEKVFVTLYDLLSPHESKFTDIKKGYYKISEIDAWEEIKESMKEEFIIPEALRYEQVSSTSTNEYGIAYFQTPEDGWYLIKNTHTYPHYVKNPDILVYVKDGKTYNITNKNSMEDTSKLLHIDYIFRDYLGIEKLPSEIYSVFTSGWKGDTSYPFNQEILPGHILYFYLYKNSTNKPIEELVLERNFSEIRESTPFRVAMVEKPVIEVNILGGDGKGNFKKGDDIEYQVTVKRPLSFYEKYIKILFKKSPEFFNKDKLIDYFDYNNGLYHYPEILKEEVPDMHLEAFVSDKVDMIGDRLTDTTLNNLTVELQNTDPTETRGVINEKIPFKSMKVNGKDINNANFYLTNIKSINKVFIDDNEFMNNSFEASGKNKNTNYLHSIVKIADNYIDFLDLIDTEKEYYTIEYKLNGIVTEDIKRSDITETWKTRGGERAHSCNRWGDNPVWECQSLYEFNWYGSAYTIIDPKEIKANKDEANIPNDKENIIPVLENDSFNGNIPNISDINISLLNQNEDGNEIIPGAKIDENGKIVIPKTTLEGVFNVSYKICEKNSPDNCSSAPVEINLFSNLKPASIKANEDFEKINNSKGGTISILRNDTFNGKIPAIEKIDLSIIGDLPFEGVSLDEVGKIIIPANNLEGDFSFEYKFCEKAFPENCTTAPVKIKLFTPEVEEIIPTKTSLGGAPCTDCLTLPNNPAVSIPLPPKPLPKEEEIIEPEIPLNSAPVEEKKINFEPVAPIIIPEPTEGPGEFINFPKFLPRTGPKVENYINTKSIKVKKINSKVSNNKNNDSKKTISSGNDMKEKILKGINSKNINSNGNNFKDKLNFIINLKKSS